jgi:uncharacterized Tic20 family protein
VSGAQSSGLSFPLRSGETCALSGDTLSVGQRTIPLSDLVAAGLVADVSVPTPPGMPPTPGVSLRLTDGSSVAFTPVEQLDCWRLLQALAAARPALATPLPPPTGAYGPATGAMGGPTGYGPGYYGPGYYGPGYYGPGYAPGYASPGFGMGGPTESEKTLAGLCHLSVFFAPVILPLIIWLAMRRTQPYASLQAKQAFWFHLSFAALVFIAAIGMQVYFITTAFATVGTAGVGADPIGIDLSLLPGIFALYGVIVALGLINVVFSIIAAIQAFQGKPYHYPLLGWLSA